jgi:phosphatidylinositol alpha-1,6-mannosyltransferase
LIAGDGEERQRLEKLRDELGLYNYVHFLGNVGYDQLPFFYGASDLYVSPSYVETFGISFIEAGASGKPVIAGRSEGAVEAVTEGKTGLLVNPYSVDEIAAAITQLLTSQELSRRLGKNGRQRAEEELNWDKMGEKLENYLCQVLN